MTASSEPHKSGCRGVQVFLVEGHHFGFQPPQKREDYRTGILAEPRCHHHCGFEQGGHSNNHNFGSIDSLDQPFVTGLSQMDGNDGGTVKDHS